MGAEGGVAGVFLVREEGRAEVQRLLEMVGMNFRVGDRREVEAWMATEGPELEFRGPCLLTEWNTCLDWLNLQELEALWGEVLFVLSGGLNRQYPHIGLGPDATFADVILEALTGTTLQYHPMKTLLEGIREANYPGLQAAYTDPRYAMTLAHWAGRLGELLKMYTPGVFWSDFTLYPVVSTYEVWT